VKAPPGWRSPDDGGAADLDRDLPARGKLRLDFGGHEFVLVAEPGHDRAGRVTEARLALRRGGSPFVGPGGTYPAAGAIVDSMSLTLSAPTLSLQRLGGGDRARLAQTAYALLERAARRLDHA